MSQFDESVRHFLEQTQRAAAQARETLAAVQAKAAVRCARVQAMKTRKSEVLTKWLKAVHGNIHGPTLFGSGAECNRVVSEMYDALVETIASRATPPNDAELVSVCSWLVAHQTPESCTDDVVQNTEAALWLFEDAALHVLLEPPPQA